MFQGVLRNWQCNISQKGKKVEDIFGDSFCEGSKEYIVVGIRFDLIWQNCLFRKGSGDLFPNQINEEC